jgi:TonB family protein
MGPTPARGPNPPTPFQPAPASGGAQLQREPDLQRVASSLAIQGSESNELALDLILHDLAEQACQLTRASGAAIALERGGEIVCRVAAGATAPNLGARINTESGLTGTCWRLHEPQLCTDTQTDSRVDAEASRRLGVRSVLVSPLFSGPVLVGVFEVFSPHPYAFTDHDLEKLQDLGKSVAKTILNAAERATRPIPGPVLISTPVQRPAQRSPETLYSAVTAAEPSRRTDSQTRALRLVVLALATVLCLLLGLRWGWYKARLTSSGGSSSTPSQPEQPPAASAEPSSASGAIPDAQAAKKAAGLPFSPKKQPDEGSQDGSVVFKQNAAERVKLPEASSTNTQKPAATNRPVDSTKQASPKPDEIAELTSQLSLRPASLPALQPPGVAAPALPALRVSQGVTGGKLIHRVLPRYPQQAMQRRIQGLVVVQAEVGKDGRVKEVKVIDGNSLLTAAAANAVREWRYEPFKLNSEPVEMTTQVTLKFFLE